MQCVKRPIVVVNKPNRIMAFHTFSIGISKFSLHRQFSNLLAILEDVIGRNVLMAEGPKYFNGDG